MKVETYVRGGGSAAAQVSPARHDSARHGPPLAAAVLSSSSSCRAVLNRAGPSRAAHPAGSPAPAPAPAAPAPRRAPRRRGHHFVRRPLRAPPPSPRLLSHPKPLREGSPHPKKYGVFLSFPQQDTLWGEVPLPWQRAVFGGMPGGSLRWFCAGAAPTAGVLVLPPATALSQIPVKWKMG